MNFEGLDFGSLTTLDASELLTGDWGQFWEIIWSAVMDPSSNLPVAILALLVASILVTIVLVIVLLFVLGSSDEEDFVEVDVPVAPVAPVAPIGVAVEGAEAQPIYMPEATVVKTRSPIVEWAFAVGIIALTWFALGFSTSTDDMCLSCHVENPHTESMLLVDAGKVEYVHADLSCVRCHEPGRAMGAYGVNTLVRSVHFARGFGLGDASDYGSVTVSSCSRCHASDIEGVVENETRGVLVSHTEPIESGLRCVDCHSLDQGLIGGGIGGMTRCISCHDNVTASATCTDCHVKDVSVAASANRPARDSIANVQIPVPDCGGCHNLVTQCDPCHGGVRLPHSLEFVQRGHAREAALDYWTGDGNTCFQCHTNNRNSCGTCHRGQFWSHPKSFFTLHRAASPSGSACATCHSGTKGVVPDRNFCLLCHDGQEKWEVN